MANPGLQGKWPLKRCSVFRLSNQSHDAPTKTTRNNSGDKKDHDNES